VTPRRRNGRVTDRLGAPAAGVLVSVAWSDAPAPEVAARTDAGGRFTLALGAGEFELVAHRAGTEVARLRVRLTDEPHEDELRLTVDA
jgi:hypothetical protein